MNILKCKLLADSLMDDKALERDLQEVFRLFTDDPYDLAGQWKKMFREPPMYDVWRFYEHDVYDFRFKYLLLNNYRKYGQPKEDTSYYGISFCKKLYKEGKTVEYPQSVFVLGNNGLGKSSLFDAMEQVCTGKISEATYRGISDLNWYVNRKQGIIPDVKLYTFYDESALENGVNLPFSDMGIDSHSFFLSENSIYELSRYMQTDGNSGDVDWVPCFCYALGLEDLLNFAKDSTGYCQALIDRVNEAVAMISDDPQKQRDNLKRFIRDTSVELSDNDFKKVGEFKEVLGGIKENFSSYDTKELLKLIEMNMPTGLTQLYSLNRFKERFKKVYANYQLIQNQGNGDNKPMAGRKRVRTENLDADENRFELITIIEDLHSSLETTMELKNTKDLPLDRIIHETQSYLLTQKALEHTKEADFFRGLPERLLAFQKNLKENLEEQFREIFDGEFQNIIKNTFEPFMSKGEKLDFVQVDHGVVAANYGMKVTVNDIPVNKYFNTFRFRLFCLSLMAAFNLKMMKKMKFRFPFVFDDIFYANDYRNKNELFVFFQVLANNANALLGDKDAVQVIFFTHDEQIVNTLLQKDIPFTYYSVSRLMELDKLEKHSLKFKEDYLKLSSEFKKNNDIDTQEVVEKEKVSPDIQIIESQLRENLVDVYILMNNLLKKYETYFDDDLLFRVHDTMDQLWYKTDCILKTPNEVNIQEHIESICHYISRIKEIFYELLKRKNAK